MNRLRDREVDRASARLPATLALLAAAALILLAGCGGQAVRPPEPDLRRPRPSPLPRLSYTVQAGAFKDIGNAVRLTRKLLARNLSAYHFIDASGFYKVRLGNFPSRSQAANAAERLIAAGVLAEYFIVAPEDHAAARLDGESATALRRELVGTAERFVGVPYQWGGESTVEGFDCSGLTMVVYQLNGMDLPRTSAEQWQAGQAVAPEDLEAGDLVFFATRGGGRVSHVGIYTGGGLFLHAPGRGSRIQTDSLSGGYFKTRYLGARSYL
jgi:cell wall-associated NlpC family hydrolase